MKDNVSYEWINLIKGVGIILIVIGHVLSGPIRDFLYMFHVPLFFFLSGYLYKKNTSFKDVLSKKFLSLILPYFVYFVLLSTSLLVIEVIKDRDIKVINNIFTKVFYGGIDLTGWFSVFWFVTSLFFTLLIGCLIVKVRVTYSLCIALVFLILAYIQAYYAPNLPFVFGLNTILYCFPIFYAGHLYSRYKISVSFKKLSIFTFLLFVLYLSYPTIFYTDIKASKYGFPILTFVISMVFVLFIFELFKKHSEFIDLRMLSKIGIASMTIMYLHQAVQITLRYQVGVESELLVIFSSIIICMLCHSFFKRNKITRRVFLGQR